MSLKQLPKINAGALPAVCAFELDEMVLDAWQPEIRASQTPENTITILDRIGPDIWGDGGVTAKRISAALRSIGKGDVFVDINSPGGDFFEGVAIYNMLAQHPGKVTVRVLGLAASAASVIAMAGDDIQISKAGFLMVHNAWSVTIGNRHDLAETINTLGVFDEAMRDLYAERAGVDAKQAAAWMDAETYFKGADAVEKGLADSILSADEVTEDETQASKYEGVNAVRRVDLALAKTGMPRSQRRSLLADMKKGGTPGAASSGATQDAGVKLLQELQSFSELLKKETSA